MFRALTAVVAAGVVVVSSLGATPASAGSTAVARWELNEDTEATVAVDATGHGLHGRVGNDIRTGLTFGKRKGYNFPYISGSSPPNLERIIEVPEHESLDPGTRHFTVTFGFRTRQSWGNLVQKGQSGMRGGFWKVDLTRGVLLCLFRDETGQSSTASSRTPLNDGHWHKVRCARTPESVVMYVDGEWRDTRHNPTGVIDNSAPLSIGGKRFCGNGVQCDYWFGDLNFIRISTG